MTPTPHNNAKKGDIAKTVLMPGDPLRAKYIAENYLEDAVCFTSVRNMLGYTGTYKGQKVSVMGSGMGMPSIGIYSYELYKFYDVDTIIRIGSAGAFQDNINIMDIIIAMGACTDSNYAYQYELPGTFCPLANFDLVNKAYEVSKEIGACAYVGNVLTSDIFYNQSNVAQKWKDMGVLGVEMESAALYMTASQLGKKALALYTVSDHMFREGELTAMERQTCLNQMMQIALEVAIKND